MPIQRLKRLLDERHIRYRTVHHSPAYTAQELAHATHISGKELAKVVMIELDGAMAMAVVPACQRLRLDAVADAANAERAVLAKESDFAELFPDCDVGAMPPFGNLWGLPVFVSSSLAEDEVIAFPAGTHFEVIQLAFEDFKGVVEPRIGDFTE